MKRKRKIFSHTPKTTPLENSKMSYITLFVLLKNLCLHQRPTMSFDLYDLWKIKIMGIKLSWHSWGVNWSSIWPKVCICGFLFTLLNFMKLKNIYILLCKLETIKIHVKKMTANRKVSLRLAWNQMELNISSQWEKERQEGNIQCNPTAAQRWWDFRSHISS